MVYNTHPCSWAWVTSALDEKSVEKAVVLAGSLKRVKVSGKLVLITSSHVPEKLREWLYKTFDLVMLMDTSATNGITAEDYAKVFAFSLALFESCVYVTSNSLALRKCDEIFSSSLVARSFIGLCTDYETKGSSTFWFKPSLQHFQSLSSILKGKEKESIGIIPDAFTRTVLEYFINNSLEIGTIETTSFQELMFCDGGLFHGSVNDVGIVSFGTVDPKEKHYKKDSLFRMGLLESYAVDLWWNVYTDQVKTKMSLMPSALREQSCNEPIAIIGMSCRFPGANNLDEFWQLLVEGRDAIHQLPSHRWDKKHALTAANSKCRKTYGGFLDFPINEFDSKFFGISPKEAEFLDPQQRLLHELTWEALEDAAVDPLSLRGSHTGVFVGSWVHDYKEIALKNTDRDFFRIYMGNAIAATTARLSFLYGITGPSIATECGCSSAIVATDLACKSLRNRETNMAIASGVNLFLHPFDQEIMPMVLAPDGRCKTFSADANGFGRSEGVGVLLLKRVSDAIADGDKIWALIRGSAISQEGVSKSLGTPTIHGESLAMELALNDAGVEAKDVSYVEAHGTGTIVGDPLEIAAITKVYSKDRTEPLWIGSVKTNVGHTEAVSGITGIIKVALSMKNKIIPAHLNFSKVNPEIDLDLIPARIPLEPVEWKINIDQLGNCSKRLAGVSSFGISGTDGHAILEEAPEIRNNGIIDLKLQRPLHIMKVTAKTAEALDELLVRYENILALAEHSGNELADIAFTSNTGRATFNHRAVIVAKDCADAVKALKSVTFKRKEIHDGTTTGKVCFLFTGQGSQYHGMAHELYKTSPVFRIAFDQCEALLKARYNMTIQNVMWNDNGSASALNRTINSQVAIFVVEYCLLQLWKSWGVKPDFALGHSLGEFGAAVCAGILDLESGLELVVQRSLLIDTLPEGKMLVIKADKGSVESLLEEFGDVSSSSMDFAAINSPDQTVVAGDPNVVDNLLQFCSIKNIKSMVLPATHAFHSRHMDPILDEYEHVAYKVVHKLKRPGRTMKCQFISGMEGKLIKNLEEIDAQYWVRHTREKVNFIEASQTVFQEGCNIFIEIGPTPVLSTFIMGNMNNLSNIENEIYCLPSIRKNQNDWVTILDTLSKVFLTGINTAIDWKGFDQFYARKKVEVPFYPFHKKKIWVDFRSTPSVIHPLVGQLMENASKSTIFESEVNLKKVGYLKDHAIGHRIIFPGAAFMEMCAVAGHSAVQGFSDDFYLPRRAITLKGLRIEAPLAIGEDGKRCILQTVVDIKDDDGDEMGYMVHVHNWLEQTANNGVCNGDGKWKQHASACFLPFVTCEEKLTMEKVNIQEIKEKWEQLSASKDLYEKLPEVGLRFGSAFQSLLCGWKNEGKGQEGILFEVKIPDDHDTYLIHPVVTDAMLQASMLWMSKDRVHKKLHVPIQIQEFVWLQDGSSKEERFVYVTNEKHENGVRPVTMLLDGMGSLIAVMYGIEFVETTVKLVESMIQQQSFAMPQLWEEIWKPSSKNGSVQRKRVENIVDNVSADDEQAISKEIYETCQQLNELDETEVKIYTHLDNLTVLYFLNALYKLGWAPNPNDKVKLNELMKQLGIVDVAFNFVKYFFNELTREGRVNLLNEEDNVYIIKDLPEPKERVEELCMQTVHEGESDRGDYRMISEMGKGLADILIGKTSPLSTLFPEDPSKPNLGYFYDAIRPWVSKTGFVLNNALSSFKDLYNTKDDANSVKFRVLEVGGGTGAGTRIYTEFLDSKQINFEYTFTDISAAFFINAEAKFEKYKNQMIFKKLNVEECPLAQGFCPEYYDLIVACEVIHATKNIRETLSNLRMLLKKGGMIQITETTKPDRRITLLVGLLEGYWRFEDLDLRPNHATLSGEEWTKTLNSTGYKFAASIGCYKDVHSYMFALASEEYSLDKGTKCVFNNQALNSTKYSWLIFSDNSCLSKEIQRRLTMLNRKVVVINKGDYQRETGYLMICKHLKKLEADDHFEGIIYMWALAPPDLVEKSQEQISLPFLHLCQAVLELTKATTRLFVITQGAFICEENSTCSNPHSATIWGISKTFRNEQPEVSLHCIDLSPEELADDQISNVFYELYLQDGEELIAFRNGQRLVTRLASLKITDEALSLSNFYDRFQLLIPSTKAIADIEFGFLNKYNLKEDEIEIQVKAVGLNFRDIFAVLKPTSQFDNINSIGSDFAGIVTQIGAKVTKRKVGDLVFGMNTQQQALPSHVKTTENMIIPIPDDFTFAEAATIPAVFATALYCLVKKAKIQREDVILIHTASGGVGLSAVQIAKHFGATIIATAGNRRKRAYLRSLGIQHVFHSRNTDFCQKILEVTENRGVDIVLNSLTGPGFKEASLGACTKNARFVEMSKLSIWKKEEVKRLRDDVEYTVADLTSLKEEEWSGLLDEMVRCMNEKCVQPIPYVRFDALNIRQALGYLQKAKHIGKVVCTMPETNVKDIKHSSYTTFLFNDRSTYLITGGLGGLGLEVAKWMLSQGAKFLVLASRSPPKADVESMIKSWNDNGKRVESWQVDVGKYEECHWMLEKIKDSESGWPPLRGVMHAAGVLSDGTLPNQTWDKFEKTYNAKVKGSINLHELTKEYRLEHFVLFSSVTSLFGSPGQSNHSASNAFEDALAHFRYSNGNIATSVNWANWGEVGVATDIDFPGIRPIATNQGLKALEVVLKSNRLQICVMNVDSFGMVAKLFPKVKSYVDDKRLLGDVKAQTFIINTDEFWGEVDSAKCRESKIDIFKRYIKNMLRNNLKLDPDENINDNTEFQAIGVDSLMLLEMKNYLQNLFGNRLMLTPAHLKDCNSAETLATRLVDMMDKKESSEEGERDNDSNSETAHDNIGQPLPAQVPVVVV